MAKRKLSIQQQRRIEARQQRPPVKLPGNDDESLGEQQEGLVVTRFGKQADVMELSANTVHRCHIRATSQDVVTGDRVIWRQGEPTGIIESVLPRSSLMSRPDNRGQLRPVAANVTQMGIVFAPLPTPHQNLIDRYLVAAEHLKIEPLLVVNKIDLDSGDEHLQGLVALYKSLSFRVIQVSAARSIGMAELLDVLREHTTVFVGQSGVGKSSLVNSLHPVAAAAIGHLSQVAKGRHTTTAATFYNLPTGGSLIDSPGIREFGLWHLAADQVAAGFREFSGLGQCKFRDCSHTTEPGCALLEAVRSGRISSARFESYHQIVNDLLQSS